MIAATLIAFWWEIQIISWFGISYVFLCFDFLRWSKVWCKVGYGGPYATINKQKWTQISLFHKLLLKPLTMAARAYKETKMVRHRKRKRKSVGGNGRMYLLSIFAPFSTGQTVCLVCQDPLVWSLVYSWRHKLIQKVAQK